MAMRVLVLTADGACAVKWLRSSQFGAELGGWLQLVPHAEDQALTAYVNEEGERERLPCSAWSDFMRQQGFLVGARGLLGTLVLCSCSPEGEDGNVPHALVRAAESYCVNKCFI